MGNVAVPPSSDSRSPLSAAPGGSKTSSIAALAIAVIGAAVMIDLAVEMFIGGSALRWWAVAAAFLGFLLARILSPPSPNAIAPIIFLGSATPAVQNGTPCPLW